jgi:hypothetical protein
MNRYRKKALTLRELVTRKEAAIQQAAEGLKQEKEATNTSLADSDIVLDEADTGLGEQLEETKNLIANSDIEFSLKDQFEEADDSISVDAVANPSPSNKKILRVIPSIESPTFTNPSVSPLR